MKSMTSVMTVCVVMVGVFLISGPSQAQENSGTVMQVVTIDTHGNTAAYLASLKAVLERIEELEPESSARVWAASISGDTVGTVYVVVEYPSLVSFAAATEKSVTDAAFAKAIAALVATGRTVESTSVLRDVTP